MADAMIKNARKHFGGDESQLARELGVTVGCLRSWERKGAPRYAHLALLAVMAGLAPENSENVLRTPRALGASRMAAE